MHSSALSGIFTSGRRPQGFSSTLRKVPIKNSSCFDNKSSNASSCFFSSFLISSAGRFADNL